MSVQQTPIRLYYDAPSGPNVPFDGALPSEQQSNFDFYKMEIRESDSANGEGTLIDTVLINPTLDYVETTKYSSQFGWFHLRLLSRDEIGFADAAEPILAEKAGDKVQSIRLAVKDTGNPPAFTDDDIISKIRLSALRLNTIRNISLIQDRYWPIIELLVRIDICHVLSFDYAKYLRLEIPGGPALSKNELHEHYIKVAESLESYYDKIKADGKQDFDDSADNRQATDNILVSSMTRNSYETGFEEDDLDIFPVPAVSGRFDNYAQAQYSKSRGIFPA